MRNKNFKYALIIAFILLIISFLGSLVFGAVNITLKDLIILENSRESFEKILIIKELRLPRELGAIIVGMSLSVAGAIMQGVTKNPLADPGLLGISGGANLAIVICIIFIPNLTFFQLNIVSFLGAICGALLVFGIIKFSKGRASNFKVILAGTAISSFFFALSEGLGLYYQKSKEVSLWNNGGLIGITMNQIILGAFIAFVAISVAVIYSRELTLLSINEDLALSLGQNSKLIKIFFFLITVILSGISVGLGGNMVFIGFVVPHLVRAFVGSDYRHIIPLCVFFGPIFLLLADTMARTINAPYETPITAICSFICLPFFIYAINTDNCKTQNFFVHKHK